MFRTVFGQFAERIFDRNKKNSLEFSYPIKETDSVILRSIKSGDKYKPSHMNGKTKTLKKLLSDLKEVHGNDLLFHQSGGCCDGSAPMCYPAKEYMVGNSDIKLGEIDGTPFYMNEDQHDKWKHTDLTIDAVKGIGGMFSLDNGTGRRFLTKSEICLVEDEKN